MCVFGISDAPSRDTAVESTAWVLFLRQVDTGRWRCATATLRFGFSLAHGKSDFSDLPPMG